jgi:hypothetical protein
VGSVCIIRGEAWTALMWNASVRLPWLYRGIFFQEKKSSSGQRLQFGYLLRAIYRTRGARYANQVRKCIPCIEYMGNCVFFQGVGVENFRKKFLKISDNWFFCRYNIRYAK